MRGGSDANQSRPVAYCLNSFIYAYSLGLCFLGNRANNTTIFIIFKGDEKFRTIR